VGFRFVIAITALGIVNCAAEPAPRLADARSAELAKAQVLQTFAQPCSIDPPPKFELPPDAPAPPPTVGPKGPFTSGVFLETALFLMPSARASVALPASGERLIRDPEVRLLGTPQLFAQFDVPSRIAIEDHTGPLAEVTLHDVIATPRQAAEARLAIELDTGLLLPTSPSATGKPPETRVHFLTAPHVGQSVASTEQIPGQPEQSLLLLITPHVIERESELRAIFQCKMTQRQHATSSTP
jgi:hypothetical protein